MARPASGYDGPTAPVDGDSRAGRLPRGRRAAKRLDRFAHLARLNALRAHVHFPRTAVCHNAHPLQVRLPRAPRLPVGVTDGVAGAGRLLAYDTCLRHDDTSFPNGISQLLLYHGCTSGGKALG